MIVNQSVKWLAVRNFVVRKRSRFYSYSSRREGSVLVWQLSGATRVQFPMASP